MSLRLYKVLVLLITISVCAFFILSSISSASEKDANGEVVVLFKRNTSFTDTLKSVKKAGVRSSRHLKLNSIRLKLIKVKSAQKDKVVERLKDDPKIVAVEPNSVVRAAWAPNDQFYALGSLSGRQWNLTRINIAGAWDITRGAGTIVAILDTGLAKNLKDLDYSKVKKGYDFVKRGRDTTDDDGHGSHVTSIIAASTNNGIGIAGISPDVKILPVKVLDNKGEGTEIELMEGLIYAYERGANVINLSLDLETSSRALKVILDDLYRDGVVIVGASGNLSKGRVSYPARYRSVIGVGATTYTNTRANYSNYGKTLDVSAPGGDTDQNLNGDSSVDGILGESIGGGSGYFFFDGTSAATPHVSGVAALLYSQGVRGAKHIKRAITSSATDLGSPGFDSFYGNGLLNANSALRMPKSSLTARVSKTRVKYRQRVKVSGKLTPPRKATIYIQAYDAKRERWRTVAKTASKTNGDYAKIVKPAFNTYFRASWNGAGSTLGQQSNEKLVRVKSAIRLKRSRSQIRRGQKVILSGRVKPGHRRQLVAIQIKAGRRWKTITRTRLSRTSMFKKAVKLNRRKLYKFRIYMRDKGHLPSASNGATVRAL